MDPVVLRRSDSHAMSRKAGNSPRRQGATIVSSCSSSKPGFSPQRTPYNTRQSLSRSYDSPEGIHRISQALTKKSGSPVLRRSASPPASSSVRIHNDSATARNQTILDDAAWMTERIQNLQKTGFLRYPSMSKLRDSGHISSSIQSLSADYGEMSCFSSSPVQSSNSRQNQTAITYADEPLSAFRLSEVTLSEEDLLTDFSSTCNSTPVSLQSGHLFDRTAEDYYQGTSCSHDAEAASSNNSPLNIRGDLLHRLEALQRRSELAAEASHSNKIDFNQDNQYLKDPWDGQVLPCNQDLLPFNHSQNAISQRSSVLSAAATPTHSTFESTSWQPEEPQNSTDSTCWLHEEAKTHPYVSHLIYSSSRNIRPEYYLPLSKEEGPTHISVASRLSSPNDERKLALKDDNFKRLALRRSSPQCQRRSEDIRPGKCLSSHKQTHPARKSRRSLERSMDSVNRSATGRGVTSVTGFSLSESCPTAARETRSTESKSTQSSFSAGYNNSTNPVQGDESFKMEVFAIEEDGQRRKNLDSKIDYDGEVSWISEENVEGFLRSRCFAVDQVDALNTSPGFSDMNGSFITKPTLSSLASEKHSQTKDKKELLLYCYERSLTSPSDKRNGCSQEKTSECIKENVEKSAMFDNCKQFFHVSKGSPTINNQTSSHCQFLNRGSLPHSHPLLTELDDSRNLLHKPVEEGKNLDSDLSVCCETFHDNIHTEGSQEDVRTKEQPCSEEKHVCCCVVKGSDKVALEGQSVPLENQPQVQITKRPFHFERSSATTSSPEIHLIENQHWPVVAQRYEKASPSQGLSERVPSHLEHRNFTKIARSLSFNGKGTSELEASPRQNTCNGLSELKSTSFSHYWIRNSAYSLDVSELLNTKGSKEPDEVDLSIKNSARMLHGSKPKERSGSMEQELLKEVLSVSEHGSTNEFCMAASEIATGEVTVSRLKSSQQCRQFQLDNSAETLYRLQGDSRVDKVVEDKDCWQQLIVSDELPKDAGKSEMYDKVILQETLNKGKDVGSTKVLSKYKNESDQIECKNSEELTLSEQHVIKASMNYQNNTLSSEDTTKGSRILEIPCSPNLEVGETTLSERVVKTPSMLSVYKNPLWLDENSTDFENHHTLQDQEFLDFTYCSERSMGFLDSDKSRLSFSQRFKDKTWDTYEGMGAFISSFPDSPCCTNKEKANDNFLGFANSSDLNTLWNIQSKIKKKLKNSSEEVETGNHELQVSESCSTSEDLISCKLAEFDVNQNLSAYGQADQHQLPSRPQATLKSDLTSQIALPSSSVKVLSIPDDNCNSFSLSSSPLLCSEQCLQLKNTTTTDTKVSSHGAKKLVSLEDCSSEQVLWPDSTYLISESVTIQDVALIARESIEGDLLHNAPSTDSTREESLLLSKIPCQTDEAKAGEAVLNNDSKIEPSRYEPCASNKAPGASSTQPSCVEHLYPLDCELSSVNATKENQSLKGPIMLSNDEMEASEEIKRVTFVYSDSKEYPHKNVNAALPEVPLDLTSTWVLSLFSHATEGDGNLKKREQKQPRKQDKSQEDQADLNTLGGKVEALEAEIDNFKRENKKLRNLVKCMISKMKQLQQGFRGRKRRGASRGFMTCIYSVRVQSSKSKTLRKS